MVQTFEIILCKLLLASLWAGYLSLNRDRHREENNLPRNLYIVGTVFLNLEACILSAVCLDDFAEKNNIVLIQIHRRKDIANQIGISIPKREVLTTRNR